MDRATLREALRAGLIAGIVVVFESLVGMVEKFAELGCRARALPIDG